MPDAARPNLWTFSELKRLFSRAYADFNEDQAPRLGAALAYYTILSLAPLLILLIAVAGLVFGKQAAEGQLFEQIRGMVGSAGAQAIEGMVRNASKPASGIIASAIALVTLLFGASSVTNELRTSLNAIWNQPQDPNEGIKEMVRNRSYALLVVLGCGFLLLVSLAVSSAAAGIGELAAERLPFSASLLYVIDILLSLAVLTCVFAFLFKFLPDVKVTWRDVLLGSVVTAVLFTIGKFLIGMYLGNASFGSTYGAAGSLVVVLVWVYYSSQIFFYGAEFTQVYACEHGSDPMCKARNKQVSGETRQAAKPLKTTPKPEYVQSAATGNAMLNISPEPAGKAAGWAGIILGSLLAGSKVRKVLHK